MKTMPGHLLVPDSGLTPHASIVLVRAQALRTGSLTCNAGLVGPRFCVDLPCKPFNSADSLHNGCADELQLAYKQLVPT